ncbi:MAG: lipoyl(octanoyl) transferase LipB [Bacteroidia bacterium]|nr:lipoyl(octanoyl) transferase LipB [Bacteroidia bacterium]
MRQVKVLDWGRIPYAEAWKKQEALFEGIIRKKLENREKKNLRPEELPLNYLVFVEHPPVYTLGKSGKPEHLLVSDQFLKEKGAEFIHTTRGGDITFHGPGQVVGYPILDLDQFFTDIHRYLRTLEEMIIRTLLEYDIKSGRSEKETGVWLDAAMPGRARKICAMGIRCSRWVTMHGFALNVNTDLTWFDYIVPCGIKGKAVASMHKELGSMVDIEDVKSKLMKHFFELFEGYQTV